MPGPGPSGETSLGGGRREFPDTRWSRLLGGRADEAAAADLARTYWKPVYAYVRAKWGKSNEDAKDLAQDFFVWMIETGFVAKADRDRGRFRAFVKVALNHYIANEEEKRRREKRGGGRASISFAKTSSADLTTSRRWKASWSTFARSRTAPSTPASQEVSSGVRPADVRSRYASKSCP